MSTTTQAVFLSYASQDAEAAKRICEALRAAGVEVWFDQSELRGGDAWDQKIRRQIKECALFIPIISNHTQNRPEGYFRLEWRLADQRTHLMGRNRAFLVPVCVDETPDADADVPDSFVAVQWMRLPDGAITPAFAERVRKLLQPAPAESASRPSIPPRTSDHDPIAPAPARRGSPRWLRPVLASAVLVIIVLGFTLFRRHGDGKPPVSPAPKAAAPLTEAQSLVARARAIMDLGGLSREKLDAASELCERALKLDSTEATAWAQAARADLLYYYPY
ncbi:MAG TPA: toll/interleukin-1 receptor domain-containing protein, partial [Candidatus Didemnitutus sp.]